MKKIEIYHPNDIISRKFLFRDSEFWARFNIPVHVSKYKKVYSCEMPDETSINDIWYVFNVAHPEDYQNRSLSMSDVVVMENATGEKTVHFIDFIGEKVISPEDFFAEKKPHITEDAKSVAVEGHKGTWYCIHSESVAGKKFFLMEHETHGDEAACVIIDENGTLVMSDIQNGFDADVLEELTLYAKDIPFLPDTEVGTREDMFNMYGYGSYHMIPVSLDTAMTTPCLVYGLYPDGTESALEGYEGETAEHQIWTFAKTNEFVAGGGLLGIQLLDWLDICKKTMGAFVKGAIETC